MKHTACGRQKVGLIGIWVGDRGDIESDATGVMTGLADIRARSKGNKAVE
jgi:hypothetical protein